jgi:hypothetical protein
MPATGATLDSPPSSAVPQQGFFSTSTGKIVAVVIGLGVLGVIVGIVFAIVAFVFVGQAVDEIDVQVQEQTSTPATGGEQEAAPVAAAKAPAPELANSAVFTFRNIFEPLLKPIPEPTPDTTATPTPDTETPTTKGTLYLTDIITEDGVLKAVLSLDDETYTLAVGERIPGTPWQVLRLTSSQVTMLFGDVQVTLGIGQGITK